MQQDEKEQGRRKQKKIDTYTTDKYKVIEFNNITSGANQENYVMMETKSSEKDSHLIIIKNKNFLDQKKIHYFKISKVRLL